MPVNSVKSSNMHLSVNEATYFRQSFMDWFTQTLQFKETSFIVVILFYGGYFLLNVRNFW